MRQAKAAGTHEVKRELPPKTPKLPREVKQPRKPWLSGTQAERLRRWVKLGALAAVLLAVLVAAWLLFRDADRRNYEHCMAQAAVDYLDGDYDSALSWLRRAESLERSDECLLLMANCYEAQGNLDRALEFLRRMDVSDSMIAQRIESVERQRRQKIEAETVTIGGRQYALDTTSMDLDGMDLTDDALSAVRRLCSLDTLSLADNRLEDVSALAELGGLITLDLRGNRVRNISPLAGLSSLRSLVLDSNPLGDLSPLAGLTGLRFLSLLGQELNREYLAELSAALPDCVIRSGVSAEDVFQITMGGVTFSTDVVELDLSGREIRGIRALESCRDLVRLNLSDNELTDLSSLMNLPALEELDVSQNQIGDLRPLMGMGKLRCVNAANNRVRDTSALGTMRSLEMLDLSGNPLEDLSGLLSLESLGRLCLDNTGLTDEDLETLGEMTALTRLEIRDNPDVSGEAVDALKESLRRCRIVHSDLVYSIEIAGLSLKEDALELDLSGQGLSHFDEITKLTCLESVDLSDNAISNIYILRYSRSRFTIRELNLASNAIEDLTALASLSAVEVLDLRDNAIRSIRPLRGLKTLRTLYISGNPVSEDQLQLLREALPDCEIITEP